MGHGFSRRIMEKYGTKYKNGNYILVHPKWKLNFWTERVVFINALLVVGCLPSGQV